LVAGDGKARPELEAHARETGFRIHFLGVVAHTDMGAIYNAADLFMFPGLREPIGMVYLEAQACGLPVVAFRNKGIPDVVRDGETGFLVPTLDRELFVERLRSLTTDTELRKSLGHAAVSFIRENHDLDRWGQALSRELLACASL
jgi:glycosyltransferase involved in cell wall biosynthesis